MISQVELETEGSGLTSIFGLPPTPPLDEGMGAEGKRKKTKTFPGTQPKVRAGWSKRIRLVQATL